MLSIMKLYEYADTVKLPNGKLIDQGDKNAYPFFYFDDRDFFIGDESGSHMSSLENYFYKTRDEGYEIACRSGDPDDQDNFLYNCLDNGTFTGRVWLDHNILAFWDLDSGAVTRKRMKDIIKNIEEHFKIKINPEEWWLEFSDTQTAIPYFVSLNDYIENKDLKYGVMDTNNNVSSEVRKAWHLLNSAEKIRLKKEYGMDKFKVKTKPLPWKQALLKSESLITNFNDFTNESIRNKMAPVSDEDVIDKLPKGLKDVYLSSKEYDWDIDMHMESKPYHFIINFENFRVKLTQFDKEMYASFLIPNKIKDLIEYDPTGYVYMFLGLKLNVDTLQKYIDKSLSKQTNESIKDKMVGKPKEYINQLTDKLPPEQKVLTGIEKQIPWLIEDGIKDGFDLKKDFTGYYLYKAGEVGNVEIIKILLDNGSDIHADNDVVFRRACGQMNFDIIKLLIDRGADVHVYDGYFLNPKHCYPNVVDFIKKHAKITESIRDQMTSKSKEEIDKIFKETDSDDERKTKRGYSKKEAQDMIKKYSDELNSSFAEYGDFKNTDQTYVWGIPNKIRLTLTFANNMYYIDFWDERRFSKKKLKNIFNEFPYSRDADYMFSKVYYMLDHALSFLSECGIDVSEIKENNMKYIRKFENFVVSLPVETNIEEMDKVYERIDAKMDLPKDVITFQKLFEKKDCKLFVVGGAVRDYLMGKKPHDFDMVTNTTPEKVMEILKDYRTDLQGVHFGVVRVFTEDEPEGYEIASYRKDISKGRDTKGSDKKVEIGTHITIKDDVKRRDLTMNALFYDIKTGQIVDVVGGVKDIENKVVRAVGNPQKRFDEDRLRILRALRFAAVTHSKLHSKTEKAIRSDSRLFNISSVDDVSRERIFLEFKKVKEKARKNNDPLMIKSFVDMLIEYDIMEQIFPVITKHKSIRPTTYLTVAIAEVLRDNEITPEFKETLKDAKIPNNFIEIISFLIDLYRDGIKPEDVYETYKLMKNKDVRRDILQEWIDVMGITDKSVISFLKYEPSTPSREIMKDGFKGAGIGNEMRRREAEKFEKLMNM